MASEYDWRTKNELRARIEELEALVQTKQESEVQLNRNWQDMKAENARGTGRSETHTEWAWTAWHELARLREENNQYRGQRDGARKNVQQLQAELTRLREELQGYRDRKFKTDYEVENARLREALEEIVRNEDTDPSGSPLTDAYFIARNALKETT